MNDVFSATAMLKKKEKQRSQPFQWNKHNTTKTMAFSAIADTHTHIHTTPSSGVRERGRPLAFSARARS